MTQWFGWVIDAQLYDLLFVGTLKVRVHGNFIPRSVFGMGFALMAIIRNIYLALVLLAGKERFDVIFVDQLPVAIPLLKKIASKVLPSND